MPFAGNIPDDLKIEANANFDRVGAHCFKKSIVKSRAPSNPSPALGKSQTGQYDGVKVLNRAFRIRLANSESSRVKLLEAGNREKKQSFAVTAWIGDQSILH